MLEDTVQFSPPLDVPGAYFNGFQLGLSNSDVAMTLLSHGQPQSVATMSFTTAKTLYLALGQLIAALEKATGREIMTMDEIAKGLEKISPKEDASEGQADG